MEIFTRIIEIFAYAIGGLLCLIGIYLVFRLISIAVFKSWIDAKKINERREDNGNCRVDRSDRDSTD